MHEIEQAIWDRYSNSYVINHCNMYAYSIRIGGKTLYWGTSRDEEDIKKQICESRLKVFLSAVSKYEKDVFTGKRWKDKYIVYPSGNIFLINGRKVKGNINSKGYWRSFIAGKTYLLHRVVAETFIPNPDNKPVVNHIDGNPLNNNVSNLEWCTPSENQKHAYRIGLRLPMRGEGSPVSKLKDGDIKYIRTHCKKGDLSFGLSALARKFGVNVTTIENIVDGNTWKHIRENTAEKPSEAE